MLVTEAPPAPPAPTFDTEIDAGVIEDARARQRRHRIIGLALLAGAAAIAGLILGFGAGGGDAAAPNGHPSTAGHPIRVGPMTVSVPPGWHWTTERGNYRNCTDPIIGLNVASYRLPVGFGKHEGPLVVPRSGILLDLGVLPIRSADRPWQRWRLSNNELRPAQAVGPNRYAAEVNLPRSPAVAATAWLGSIPARQSVLAAANRILRSVRINQAYGCN